MFSITSTSSSFEPRVPPLLKGLQHLADTLKALEYTHWTGKRSKNDVTDFTGMIAAFQIEQVPYLKGWKRLP